MLVHCLMNSHHTESSPFARQVIYLNFLPLEIVSRYRDPQLQVGEKYSFLFNLILSTLWLRLWYWLAMKGLI